MNREEHLSKTLELTQAAMEPDIDAEVIEITPDTDFPEIDKEIYKELQAEIKKLEAFICKMATAMDFEPDYDTIGDEYMDDNDFHYIVPPDGDGWHSRGSDGWKERTVEYWQDEMDDGDKVHYIMKNWEDN